MGIFGQTLAKGCIIRRECGVVHWLQLPTLRVYRNISTVNEFMNGDGPHLDFGEFHSWVT